MRKLLIICLLLCCTYTNFAQNLAADSLKRLLQNSKEDTNRALQLWQLSRNYLNSKPDTAMLLAQQSVTLSRKLNFKRGEALGLSQSGNVFSAVGNYPAALAADLAAKEIIEEIGDDNILARMLSNLADVYFYQGDYKRSIDYSHQAIHIMQELKDSNALLNAYTGLGDTYEKNNKLDSAWHYTRLGYQLSLGRESDILKGITLNNLGNIFRKSGQPDSAMLYYKRSIFYSNKTSNYDGLCETFMGMAYIFLNNGQPDSSLYYAKLSYATAKEREFTFKLLEASNFLAAYYKSANNIDSAYAYQQATITAKDSLFSQQKVNQMQSMTYDEFMRQQQIEEAKKQERVKAKQNALIGGLVTLFIVIFLLVLNNRQKKKANHQIAKQKEKVEETLQELKTTQAQLIQSEKMASLGELTAGIAHEIQNPLNFVNNFSEVNRELIEELKSKKEKLKSEELDELLDDIDTNLEKVLQHGKRADAIVKGMLQHSRKSEGLKEPTDINALCDEYLRLAYHGMKAKDKAFNAEIKTDFDETIGKINVVRQDIGRVLLNLFNNAFYAVQEKARLIANGYQPTAIVSTRKLNDRIEIRVEDNANGIPKHIIDKIFQPFFTTKPTGQGTGLGLSLSYDIIKAHGGEIRVEGEKGEGTTFIINIPTR